MLTGSQRASASDLDVLLLIPERLIGEALAVCLQADERWGQVTVAHSLPTALSLAIRRPRWIIVDRQIPGRTLRLVVQSLRDRSPRSCIVILTDFLQDLYIQDAEAAGAMALVTRRSSLDELRRALEDAARGQKNFPTGARRRAPRSAAKTTPIGLEHLTSRELDVMLCLGRGMSLRECAESLGLSPSTADNHRTRLMHKLGAHHTIELTWIALREGMLTL